MQKRRDLVKRLVASLIAFSLVFTNFATLGSALVVYAADDNRDSISFSAQFVMIENSEENTEEPADVNQDENQEVTEFESQVEETMNDDSSVGSIENDNEADETSTEQVNEAEISEEGEKSEEELPTYEEPNGELEEELPTYDEPNGESEEELSTYEESESEPEEELSISEEPTEDAEEPAQTVEEQPVEEPAEEVSEGQVLENGLALEITVGVNDSGYLKNAKVDIKDLANQIFTLKDDISLGEFIQSIEDGKIKLKQINNGTEIKVYIPIELKTEEYVNIAKLQEGVEVVLTTTYVNNEGSEEILTKSVKPVLGIQNDFNLVVGSEIEKFIPYTKDGVNEALVQIRVTIGAEGNTELPIKDTTTRVTIPEIEGTEIKDVSVAAISTGYTNGLTNGEVVFTTENWSYSEGAVNITVDNVQKDGMYKRTAGNDEYIISYKYANVGDISEKKISSTVEVKSNVFTSEGTKEISNQIEKEYDLSQANSNIITYELTRKTGEISKGYLYANANSEGEAEYEIEYDNTLDVNISRVDLVKVIEIRESDEYFTDGEGNRYTLDGNTYYKTVRVNRENLLSIIGENGSLELLLEDGTSLIEVNKDTEDEGDGYITISFGENRIGKIIIRINNPEAEGILDIVSTKAIERATYGKIDLAGFTSMNSEYIAAAELVEGIVTEMGGKAVSTELVNTITDPTISLSRNDLSTLVKNEDIEIEISLNNATPISDMYKNPVFELTLPREVEEVEIKDINLLYGNDELEIGNVETLRNENGNIVLKITLNGVQTKYVASDSTRGTSIILKTDMTVDMYTASRNSKIEMNYYNEDATNYGLGTDWKMLTEQSNYMLIGRQGTYDTALNIVAPEGLVNAQMISNYKDDASIISINQGSKQDTIGTFKDARTAEMKMIVINNSEETMEDVSILGRTMFNGNKAVVTGEALGSNFDAPMVSEIIAQGGKTVRVYYSENGEATKDLNDIDNGWTEEVNDFTKIKSFLIVVDEKVEVGDILVYSYNFNIPANLTNNIDLAGTFATYYKGKSSESVTEADKILLTTGDAPILKVETVSDIDENTAVEGEHIKYTVRVTNEGRTTSTNTVVNSIIPDGTTYVNENGELEPDTTELRIELGNIAPGRTHEATYEVVVDSDTEVYDEIRPDNNVESDGLEEPIYTTVENPILIQSAQASVRLTSDMTKYVIQGGKEVTYTTHIVNKNGEALKNCKIEQNIPEGLKFVEAYIEEFNNDGITTYKGTEGVYNSETRTVTWEIDEIKNFKNFKVKVVGENISELEKTLVSKAKFSAENLNKEYSSNELSITIARPQIETTYYSSKDNKYIKEGDVVEYILELKNTGKVVANDLDISNSVPEDFKVVSVECTKDDGYSFKALAVQNVNLDLELLAGQSAKVVLKCIAENLDTNTAEKQTSNTWQVSGTNVDVISTRNLDSIIQKNPDQSRVSTTKNNDLNFKDNELSELVSASEVYINSNSNEKTKENDIQSTYRIIGRAFNDLNKNGQRDDNESGMANIVAKLCDASSQKIVAQVVTNDAGEYVFNNVTPGNYYVKFEYDSSKYQVTDYKKEGVNADRNSDAIVSNYKAVTDKITVTDTSISDIDVGFYTAGIFDLSIDANVNRLTVQNEEETTTYEMENSKLAKIDIDPKYADSTKIFVEYTIDVSNKGEISGYVKSLMSYLPTELELDTSLNANWYIGTDGNAHTRELENVLIQPGETKTITLILTKQMTEDGTGLVNNTFEIESTFNEYAIADIDSTEGNHADGEDDMSSVDVIIGIKTGGSMINVMLITSTLIVLLAALYVIKLRIDNKNGEVMI